MKAFSYCVVSVVLVFLATVLFAHSQSVDLPNFHKVNDGLYRGGQPKEDGFAQLQKMGIKTVIDLRSDSEDSLKEQRLVEKAGMRFINLPLGNWSRPDPQQIDRILAKIDDPKNQPVFVHCRRGSDRTGTVIAIYRMTHDGWNTNRARDEAETFGLGWWQFGMRDFISDYYRDNIKK